MHSQYLRQLFLNDALSEGRYRVAGKPVSLTDIHTPSFCVATLTDHVAPWRSVYKLHYLVTGEVHFVLTSGGHNAGIISAPGQRTRPAAPPLPGSATPGRRQLRASRRMARHRPPP